MPLPFILGAIGIGSAILGAAGHAVAKEDNERAQSIARRAKNLFDQEKASLEAEAQETEAALEALGKKKAEVLGGSMDHFLQHYDRIKHIELKSSTGLNDFSKMQIDDQGVLQMREMSSVYGIDTFASGVGAGVASAAAGSAIALAASGCLGLVPGALSVAGGLLSIGEVGLAAGSIGIAGSAVGMGLSATPLAAIVGPALFGSALKASFKADENVEKAQTMMREAEAAAEKMKVSKTVCKGVTEKSRMFEQLLITLNKAFSPCVDAMINMIEQKGRIYGDDLSKVAWQDQEKDLLMITRALAGTVKSVIDIPLLDKDGKLMDNLDDKYNEMSNKAPKLQLAADQIMGNIQSDAGNEVKKLKSTDTRSTTKVVKTKDDGAWRGKYNTPTPKPDYSNYDDVFAIFKRRD